MPPGQRGSPENLNREKQKMLDSVAGKRIMHTPRAAEKSEAALLFNNLSDNLCGHSKIRILDVARRKMNTKSQE